MSASAVFYFFGGCFLTYAFCIAVSAYMVYKKGARLTYKLKEDRDD